MKDFFSPESLGPKHGCALYTEVHYTQQNTVPAIKLLFSEGDRDSNR